MFIFIFHISSRKKTYALLLNNLYTIGGPLVDSGEQQAATVG